MEAAICPRVRVWMAAFGCAVAVLLLIATAAKAGIVTDGVPTDGGCPAIADKPDAAPHVDYQGVKHITYCYGPITISPGQNVIRFRPANDGLGGQNLWPQVPGYITRFDPEFIYADGTVPRVDVLHLHHAVWAVNGAPQFAVGEEKTVQQLPQGFGWRSMPTDSWILNDMLHDLVAQPAQVYVVWRIDFVPDSSPAAASIHTVHTKWLDVAGNPSIYPVFDALRADGHNGTYTFPDQAPAADLHPCGGGGGEASWPAGSHGCLGAAQSWTPEPERDADRHRRAPAPWRPRHAAARQTRQPDQHALHLRRPLLRAGRRGLLGRGDGCDPAFLACAGTGGRHSERARDL